MWQNAARRCFYRIAGKEKADRAVPPCRVSAASRDEHHGDRFVAGMFRASQLAGIRFFPIVPGQEEESWKILAEQWFPAYLRGEAWKIDMQAEPFYEQMCSEFNVVQTARNIAARLELPNVPNARR